MKIAILGTRGIPNHYGGFEQYAELLSTFLVLEGWDVTVYNTHNHPYKSNDFNGVKIIHKYNPENYLGSFGQFVYDLQCILNIRKKKYDIVYQLGYTSSAIFNFLLPKKTLIVTNMDGLEWKRTKYGKYVQKFLLYSEGIVARKSDFLIADSLGIKDYIYNKYKIDSFYSSYTANPVVQYQKINWSNLGLNDEKYNLLVARLVPENNVEVIIESHTLNNYSYPLLIIGNSDTKFGQYLLSKFNSFKHIHFIGGIYDKQELNALRNGANLYFHGHSVGGTNPSLLEAMACECNIVAHDNTFNKSILGDNAMYFSDAAGLNEILKSQSKYDDFFARSRKENLSKIKNHFSEQFIFNSLKEKLIEWYSKNASS